MAAVFFVTVHASTAYRHIFHATGKFYEKHTPSMLVLDMHTRTFLLFQRSTGSNSVKS